MNCGLQDPLGSTLTDCQSTALLVQYDSLKWKWVQLQCNQVMPSILHKDCQHIDTLALK